MSLKYEKLDQQLAGISGIIDNFIAHQSEHPFQLIDIEKWLNTLLDRINKSKLYLDSRVAAEQPESKWRRDGIIVFDGNLNVKHFAGPRNYFFGSDFDHCKKISLQNFFLAADILKIKQVLEVPANIDKRPQFEFIVKTGPGTSAPCALEIDRVSCKEGNLYMALLRFPDNPEKLINDYQRMMLDSLPGMDIYLFDRNYRFVIAGGLEKYQRFGKTNSDYIGKTLHEVVDKKTLRSLFPFYSKALSGIPTEGEIRFQDQVYYVVATPVIANENETVGGIVIVQNVTSDKRLEQQLRKRKDEAQKADRTKSIFIANLSHEMRTPLNSIIGFSDQLRKTQLDSHQANMVNLVQTASNHLLYLVNEVVFLFKLGMGKVYIEKIPFSLKELLEEIHKLLIPKAEEKKLDFTISQQGSCPDLLIGDPYRLRQVLMNLLVNAFKFTDEGSVKLRCAVKKQKNGKIEVAFNVVDTGIGIKKEDMATIFDVFEQGASRAENMRGGAGLGLGICRNIVELLKGEITVKSKLGVGSVFSVTLPFEVVTSQPVSKRSRTFSLSEDLLEGKKIFMADDDQHNLLLSEMIFKGWKVDYQLAADGKKALDLLSQQKFDGILLDIQMPNKTGLEIVEFIRSQPDHPNYRTPIISISANVLRSDILHYLESGFNDYLTKPFQEEEMYNVLCFNIFDETNYIPLLNTDLPKNDKTDDVMNLSELYKTSAGDKAFEKAILQNFRDQSFALSKDFHTGLKSQNWKKIGEKAHKAIPSFKYFGLGNIVTLLETIERKALRDKDFSNLLKYVKESHHAILSVLEQFDALLLEINDESNGNNAGPTL
jgi:signal transduction histidine kinase/ActR/RegA family two-component response regulator